VSSRGRQRSPEELAAVLARLADQAGDPEPRQRSGGGRRRPGSPLRPAILDAPTQRVPEAPARVAERAAPRRTKPPEARVADPPRRTKPPEARVADAPPVAPKPAPILAPPPKREPAAKSPSPPDTGGGLIVGTPISRATEPGATARSGPRPPATNSRATGGARAIPKRRPAAIPKVRRGDRTQRTRRTPIAGPRLGRRASGRIGGQPRARRRQPMPISFSGRTFSIVLVGLALLVILILLLTSGGGGADRAAVTTPVKPTAASVPATPATPTTIQTTTQQAATTTAAPAVAVAANHKPVASKPHVAAPKHKPASSPSKTASNAANANSTAATSPAQSSATPYYRPAPVSQPRPTPGSAGSSLGAAALLGHRRSRHHKK
jgi:hypothetical protein